MDEYTKIINKLKSDLKEIKKYSTEKGLGVTREYVEDFIDYVNEIYKEKRL